MSGRDNTTRILTLRQMLMQYRVVIPEIQREYVWGDALIGRNVLGHFFKDFKKDLSAYTDWKATPTQDHNGEPKTSVGVVYAYYAGMHTNEDAGRTTVNLIDGQQRWTTYFLMLLHAAVRSGRYCEFLKLVYPPDGQKGRAPSFDFNVRVMTHAFLTELMSRAGETGTAFDFSDMQDAAWYLQAFCRDVSIRSMTNALQKWDSAWGTCSEDAASVCYDYLLNNVEFLFFPIQPIQGEQLYITMNGRGRNLSQPEIMRAKIFRDAEEAGIDPLKVGRLFEEINDFFWRHRIEKELTADAGERKFYRWTYLLWKYQVSRTANDQSVRESARTAFRNALQTRNREERFELDEDMFGPHAINFELIESTFLAVRHLYEDAWSDRVSIVDGAEETHSLSDYLPKALNSSDEDEGSFQIECFKLLPVLRFAMEAIPWQDTPSVRRELCLTRFMCNIAQRAATKRGVNELVEDAIDLAVDFSRKNQDWCEYLAGFKTADATRVKPEDEILKAQKLLKSEKTARTSLSELIWVVEDFQIANGGDSLIAPFLDMHKNWRSVVWGSHLCRAYRIRLDRIKSFFNRLDKDRQRTTEWLMFPHHRGYYLRNDNKVMRRLPQEFLGMSPLLNEIVRLEGAISRSGASDVSVFDAAARDFLEKYWDGRERETDAITLGALALVASRIVRKHRPEFPVFNNEWANLLYQKTYYDHAALGDKYDATGVSPFGGADFSLFFWPLEMRRTNMSWQIVNHSRLLPCHQVDRTDLDSYIADFCGRTEDSRS